MSNEQGISKTRCLIPWVYYKEGNVTYSQGTVSKEFSAYEIADVSAVAGCNIQIGSIPSGSHVVVTEIKLLGTQE